MMRSTDRYHLQDKLYESRRTVVYRAVRQPDQQPVVLKVLKADVAGPHNLRRQQIEARLLGQLADLPVIRCLGSEDFAGSRMLVLEDIGGQTLAQLLQGQPLPAEEFLPLAISLVEIVRELHRRDIVHRDLNPANILVSPATRCFSAADWQLRLIDFDAATWRAREEVELHPPAQIDGSLPYLAPEQSGRMNRVADYRADYYSLGVTFYEMLAGQLPFNGSDVLSWLHSHVALRATPPHELNQQLSEALSRIVMRLLAKSPDDRYQSATGLLLDLHTCLESDAGHGLSAGWLPGSNDMPEELRMPQRLYGRGAEIALLRGAFEQILQGEAQLALVSGDPGTGKTSLVHHVINLGADRPGYVLEGKFDQYQRDIPYAAWIQAFNRLLQSWLSESPERLDAWRQRVLEGVGDGVGMLAAVLPNAAWLLGREPPPAVGDRPQHQFDYVLQRFVACVASDQHPLTVFLDDLQWADAASVRLLKVLLTDPQMRHLLVIGAYRPAEVGADHPLSTLDPIGAAGGPKPVEITLQGLAPEDVRGMLGDTLHAAPERISPLAAILFDCSSGNPFELGQMLQLLRDRSVIRFNAAVRCWEWDDEALRVFALDHERPRVAAFAVLDRLAEPSVQLLQLAACVGDRFQASILAMTLGEQEDVVSEQLGQLVRQGLILPVDGSYRFIHDRVRQTIYDGLTESQRGTWHLRIGRLLQSLRDGERLFEVVSQLNQALPQLPAQEQRSELAALNLQAAHKAREAAAYAEGSSFAAQALQLLPRDGWQEDSALLFDVHREVAELHYLSGESGEAETVLRDLLERQLSVLQRADVLNLLITVKTMRAEYQDALTLAREALSLLGIRLPEGRKEAACEELTADILGTVAELPDGALASMPDMQSAETGMAVRILATLAPITYFVDQALYPYVVGRLTQLCMTHGPTRDAAFGYASFGLILASRKVFYSAYLFGEAAEALAERYRDPGQQCKALQIVANHIKLWGAPIADADALNAQVYRLGLQSGELQFAGYSRNNHVLNSFYRGVSLAGLDEQIVEYLEFCRRTGNVIAEDTINSVRLPLRNLMALSRDANDFHDEQFLHGDAFLGHCREHDSNYAICSFLTHKGVVLYLYGDYQNAQQCLAEAEDYLAYMPASIVVVQWRLFTALAVAALATPGDEVALARVKRERGELALLAEHAPANFLHAQLLVDAELARLQGQLWQAMELYDQAIDRAEHNGLYHHQAIANELAGRFWVTAGKPDQARLHLDAAHEGYRRWGAVRKAHALRRQYLDLWLQGDDDTALLLEEAGSERLDWLALLKASQSMAAEIRMDRLLANIMESMLENAGAERGLLLLRREGKWWVEAEGGNGDIGMLVAAVPLEQCRRIPHGILYYVTHSGEDVVLGDACHEGGFVQEPYVNSQQLRSVLCTPLIHRGEVLGALYLENGLAAHVFSEERLAVLKILCGQAAVALQNARLYGDLESRVKERTRQLEALNSRLETLASTDHLTGIMNRRRFQEQMQLTLAQARRYGASVSLLLFDIDHFKAVNDRFGHGMGDRVLQEIGSRAQRMLRETDLLARWGGEEFIILSQHAGLEDALTLAERLRSVIADMPFAEVGSLTASFGVVCSAGDDTPERLISAADRALYAAKDAGRNCVKAAAG
jgi:diguanylate cyclase (GGDEF)-like protein